VRIATDASWRSVLVVSTLANLFGFLQSWRYFADREVFHEV